MKKESSTLNGCSNISSLTGESESHQQLLVMPLIMLPMAPLILLLITPPVILIPIMPQEMLIMLPMTPVRLIMRPITLPPITLPKKQSEMVGGRPKGSTDAAAAKDLERHVEVATKEVVKTLMARKKESSSNKKRLWYGLLDELIELSKKKYCLPDDVIISKECVCQRVRETPMTIMQDKRHPD